MSAPTRIQLQSSPPVFIPIPVKIIPGFLGQMKYPDGRTVAVEVQPLQIGHSCPVASEIQNTRELLKSVLQTNAALWRAFVDSQASLQGEGIILQALRTRIQDTVSDIHRTNQEFRMNLRDMQQRVNSSVPHAFSPLEEKMIPNAKRRKTI